MNTSCPHCGTTFRVDPVKVPAAGVRARCSVCRGVFTVSNAAAPAAVPVTASVPAAPSLTATPAPPPPPPAPAAEVQPVPAPFAAAAEASSAIRPAPTFGSNDPHARARRLARALVSDMATYHPERRERGLQAGTLKHEFREEIRKSWQEYVEQVGADVAQGTTHFRDALNDILARGQKVF